MFDQYQSAELLPADAGPPPEEAASAQGARRRMFQRSWARLAS